VNINALSSSLEKDLSLIFKEQYYYAVCDLGIQYVSKIILRILKSAGIWSVLSKNYFSAHDLIEKFNFVSSSEYSLVWMLRFLVNNGYLESLIKDSNYVFKAKSTNPLIDVDELRSKILSIDSNLLASCTYMEFISDYYIDFFNGKVNGYEILFTKNKMRLWNDYFSNSNSGYAVYNQLGALGVKKWLSNSNKDTDFLEIGSGTGNASLLVLKEIESQKLDVNIKNYILSDISPMFLRLGKRNISENYKGSISITAKKVDFNIKLKEQDISKNNIGVIYGVNALHAAKNLFFSLKEIYQTLNSGGMLIISECVREKHTTTLVQEIIFNLLESYTNVEVDKVYRKTPGFLTFNEWIDVFKAVGFVDIDFILNSSNEDNKNKKNPIHAMVLKGVKR
jgi:SAM-dependent methyltransferase